jgi:hypothetical protein
MQRIGIRVMAFAGVVALLLMAGTSTSAIAKAPTLDLTADGQPVLPTDLLKLTSFEFTLASPSGSVKCVPNEPTLGGAVTNDAKTDKIRLTADGESLTFLFAEACTASTGLGKTAEVVVEGPEGSPETLNLQSSGKAELASNSKEPISVLVVYQSTGDECLYTAPKLKGTVTLASVKAMEIFLSQKMKLDKRRSLGPCPKAATFSSGFLAHDGEFFVDDHLAS